jgi:hypothetical protein
LLTLFCPFSDQKAKEIPVHFPGRRSESDRD